MLHVPLKRMCILCVWGYSVLKISINPDFSTRWFRISLDLLVFCLEGLSIHISGVLKYSTIIVFLLISPFVSVSICFMYLSTPLLGAYTLKCVMSFSLSFYHYIVCFFVFLYDLHFKVHIVWYTVLLSLLFFISVWIKYLFISPYFQSICVLCPKVDLF